MACRFINKFQSKEERKEKYRLLKEAGLNFPMRQRARDWTMSHVNLIIGSMKGHPEA